MESHTSTSSTSKPVPINANGPTTVLLLAPRAKEYIDSYRVKKNLFSDQYFRISVEGGGCSGFQYNFTFDQKKESDLVVTVDQTTILLDPATKPYVHGSTLDYTDDLKGSGFTITNPNAKSVCGCGVSFTV